MLELVELPQYAKRKPSQLSGGQQQRVALARALVIRPRLLLMDEPLGALDLQLREQMQGQIRRIQRELRVTTIYVTHDQTEAFALSDRIVIVHQGRIVANDTPGDIYRRPSSSFAASFVGTSTVIELPCENGALTQPVFGLPGASGLARLTQRLQPSTARVFVTVRPECVRITPTPSPGAEAGTVATRRFVGMAALVTVDVGGARVAGYVPGGDVEEGDRVFVSWDVSDAHVVEEDAHGRPAGAAEQDIVPVSASAAGESQDVKIVGSP
jgi:ABC-type Fe3+/spermidine/putrescine transport system ATPase subunit